MTYVTREKFFSKQWFKAYSFIVLGCFIMSVGFNYFISPHHIVPGGVYGIGIVVNFLTEGMFPHLGAENGGFPIGTLGFILNIPLTILGIKILGPKFGVKTIVGFVLCMIFMDYSWLTVRPLIANSDVDPLLSSIFGGILIGFGLGLIFKSKATSGGSDIIAMILEKYTKMPLGQLLMTVDSIIVIFGLAVFRDWRIPLYSWITIFVTGKVIDTVLAGISAEKCMIIISDKHEEIRERILFDINRGGTYLPGVGLYKREEKKIIYTVVNRRELSMLTDYIREVDRSAFITVLDATEILGNGFKPLDEIS
jgi:Uncharacterized conserved protein